MRRQLIIHQFESLVVASKKYSFRSIHVPKATLDYKYRVPRSLANLTAIEYGKKEEACF